MAKRRKTKKASSRSFSLISLRDRKRQQTIQYRQSLLVLLKILAIVGVLGGVVIAFVYLDEYVANKSNLPGKTAKLELVNPPYWVNQQLKEKIYSAARAGGEDLKLDEDAAASVQQNLERFIAWLYEVQVRSTHNSLQISGQWRKPLALIESPFKIFYVDANSVVLNFVPMTELPIVKVVELSSLAFPEPGSVWHQDDLFAALDILDVLDQMDRRESPDKPLLYEIDRIDVSNFEGRLNSSAPHILLYAKDETEIIWGAELGKWQRYLESPDEVKLAKLYVHYKVYGSLMNNVKYIDLSIPQNRVPQPVDKY